MAHNSTPSRRIRQWFLAGCFMFFLYPISIDGNSANYTFMLVPLVAMLVTSRIHLPSEGLLACILFYVSIFILATIYQVDLLDAFPRRITSFVLFMSMFSFMFVKIDNTMIRAFKWALVAAGVFFSASTMLTFFALGGSALSFEAKEAVGGQRYGFVYIFAFWLLFLSTPTTFLGKTTKFGASFVVLIGLVLTFSRASIVALGTSFAIYLLWTVLHVKRFSWAQMVRGVVVTACGLAVAIGLVSALFPVVLDFFNVRLFEFLADSETVQGNLADADTSEGTRIFIWRNIIEYVLRNPLTGSGYFGVWILRLFDEMSGSAHNQYFDVLFRVGWIGFLIHVVLLYRTARHLTLSSQPLFWGYLGVIVYGVFHETFKESHGAFVLSFLFGMMSQRHAYHMSGRSSVAPGLGTVHAAITASPTPHTQHQR